MDGVIFFQHDGEFLRLCGPFKNLSCVLGVGVIIIINAVRHRSRHTSVRRQ